MPLAELQATANFSNQICLNALHERGLKAYNETLKLVLGDRHCHARMHFALPKLNWAAGKE